MCFNPPKPSVPAQAPNSPLPAADNIKFGSGARDNRVARSDFLSAFGFGKKPASSLSPDASAGEQTAAKLGFKAS